MCAQSLPSYPGLPIETAKCSNHFWNVIWKMKYSFQYFASIRTVPFFFPPVLKLEDIRDCQLVSFIRLIIYWVSLCARNGTRRHAFLVMAWIEKGKPAPVRQNTPKHSYLPLRSSLLSRQLSIYPDLPWTLPVCNASGFGPEALFWWPAV